MTRQPEMGKRSTVGWLGLICTPVAERWTVMKRVDLRRVKVPRVGWVPRRTIEKLREERRAQSELRAAAGSAMRRGEGWEGCGSAWAGCRTLVKMASGRRGIEIALGTFAVDETISLLPAAMQISSFEKWASGGKRGA
ncbi:hypothetical protein KM043_001631 [Ampulex compressa]|nr:hypothetical protein KM043_001631 [Ampulex compressa]